MAAEPTEAPAAEGPNVLKVANTANITTWDPVGSFSTEAAYLANIYEQLLRVNPPGADEQFTPLLAESWEIQRGWHRVDVPPAPWRHLPRRRAADG